VERGAAFSEDRRHAEIAADRDELPAGHGDGLAVRERVEREEERGSGIRDRHRVEVASSGREEREDERPDMLPALPAIPLGQIVFERRETGGAARGG